MNASIQLLTGSEKGVLIMSRKKFNREGQIPHNLYEMINIKNTGDNGLCAMDDVLSSMHIRTWFNNSESWYHFLDDVLNDWIYNNYKLRPIKYDLINEFESPFNNYCVFISNPQNAHWTFRDFVNDYSDLELEISNICHNVFLANQEKYKKLYDAMTLEFNPLWNVDGTEEITRTLERDGTIVNAKSGNDATAKSGNDALVKSGTVTDAESGTTAEAHTGTITNAQTGTDTMAFEGSETDTKNGVHTSAITGGEIHEKYEATTDSLDLLKTEKNVDTFGDDSNMSSKTTTDTDTNVTNVHAFTNNRRNVDTKNLSNTQTNANTDTTTHGKTDTTTYNNTDTQNYNSTDTTTYNSSNTETLDTIDTERTIHERHGNIGVTTTTKLLTELSDYAQYFNYVDIVAKDLINAICEGVY